MIRQARYRTAAGLVAGLILVSSPAWSVDLDSDVFTGLRARSIGPALMSGRIMAIDAVAGETSTTDNTVHDAIANHQVVISSTPQGPQTIALQSGQATPTTGSPQPFEVTPNQGVFNLVALSGDDRDLTVEGVTSSETGTDIDFVLANGNNGQIPSPSTGTAEQVSGSTPANLFHTASSLIGAGVGFAGGAALGATWKKGGTRDMARLPRTIPGRWLVRPEMGIDRMGLAVEVREW